MKTNSIKNIIGMMVKTLVEKFDPDLIILFGSHTRGTVNDDCDFDMLVVFQMYLCLH
jgi:predicted nucleotidyltransferase